MLIVLISLCSALSAQATPISDLVISEIMYEPSGNDNGRQWVEIYNGTGSTVDLSIYRLDWGRGGLSDSILLSGILATDTTFVIGGPTSDTNNGAPTYDQIFDFNPNLGDGSHFFREDGVALVEISTSTVVHIVVYGGNGSGTIGFLDEQGNLATVVDDSGLGQGESLEYLGSDTWQVQSTTTPGVASSSLIVSTPEPSSGVLMGLGLVGLAMRRRRSD